MNQFELAEFLEDNMAYITKPVSGADLLSMAQNIKVQLKGSLEIEETVSRGLKTLSIKDDSIIRGQNSKGKNIVFPESLSLSLRVFKNQPAFNIDVFLRMRRHPDSLEFWITIPDPKAIEEAAFDKVIDEVKATSKLPTLKGSF